jgi:hypothetical protein
MALPFGTTGSLRPTFVTARLICLAVKHTFYLCARRLIANQAECTFVLLRYSFGGDRPSQTAQLTMSVALIQGTTLELKHSQAGISTTTLLTLARQLHSLPAILHKIYLRPISAYSKGSWGLSV